MRRASVILPAAAFTVLLAAWASSGAPPFTASVHRVTAADLRWSYRPGCPVPPDRLRLLRLAYWGFDGRRHLGRLVVNAAVVPTVEQIFARLYAARVTLRRMQ